MLSNVRLKINGEKTRNKPNSRTSNAQRGVRDFKVPPQYFTAMG